MTMYSCGLNVLGLTAWLGAFGSFLSFATNAEASPAAPSAPARPLYTYALRHHGSVESYDEAMAVACFQGLMNRESAELYLLSPTNARPRYWLTKMTGESGWLKDRPLVPVPDLTALARLARPLVKGIVIWDPAVPATLNVASTVAGVEDGIVLSPEFASRFGATWNLPVLVDLRGRFTGAETGSPKNDAYRWALRHYLAKGFCSSRFLCLYEDAFAARARGELGYVVTRDWAVKQRAFVFDLSPWGDERPKDDPDQRLGLDLETYRMVLAETLRQTGGLHMTELTGFFVFSKYANMPDHTSAHEPVPTEWETVHLISPYNAYQNTVSSDAYNQSLHSQAPRPPLRQARTARAHPLEAKTYLCFLMADYDSSYVLYDFLPKFWDDPNRGRLPLAWGINPNLRDTYPDVIAHFYRTLTPADTITADAGAAGYINPSRIPAAHLPLFVRHNQDYFREADLTIAPMVLDWVAADAAVKDAFTQFAPDGFGSMVWDMHRNTGPRPVPQVWKGMPFLELINDANEFPGPEKTAEIVAKAIKTRGQKTPGFHFFRIVWTGPSQMLEMLAALRRQQPGLDFEVLDVHTFFALFKQQQTRFAETGATR